MRRIGSLQTEATAIASAASARRSELAREWLRSSQAGILLGARPDEAEARVKEERCAGRLLGAWVPDEQDYRYPPWQFDRDGKPIPQLANILAILRQKWHLNRDGHHTSGWSEIAWFIGGHALLECETPAYWLATDPGRVLAVAHREFIEEADDW